MTRRFKNKRVPSFPYFNTKRPPFQVIFTLSIWSQKPWRLIGCFRVPLGPSAGLFCFWEGWWLLLPADWSIFTGILSHPHDTLQSINEWRGVRRHEREYALRIRLHTQTSADGDRNLTIPPVPELASRGAIIDVVLVDDLIDGQIVFFFPTCLVMCCLCKLTVKAFCQCARTIFSLFSDKQRRQYSAIKSIKSSSAFIFRTLHSAEGKLIVHRPQEA